jgi:hypothetical protein
MARPPGRPLLQQLRPGEGDHEQRLVARPLQQVLDEVEQARVRPLHVLEGEHGRVGVGQPLEEQPPGREQILPLMRRTLSQAEQLRQPRLHEAALLRIEQMLFACSFPSAGDTCSSSAIRQRIRTMSASAQYVTPSP